MQVGVMRVLVPHGLVTVHVTMRLRHGSFVFVLVMVGFVLHYRYIKPAAEEQLTAWCARNWRSLVISNLAFLMALIFFGGVVQSFLLSHRAILYFICALILFGVIEVVATLRTRRK